MNTVTPVRTRIGEVAVLALLTFDGALLGAFSLAFTPMYVAGFPAPMGILFAVLILPWLVTRAGEVDARPAAGLWALREVTDRGDL